MRCLQSSILYFSHWSWWLSDRYRWVSFHDLHLSLALDGVETYCLGWRFYRTPKWIILWGLPSEGLSFVCCLFWAAGIPRLELLQVQFLQADFMMLVIGSFLPFLSLSSSLTLSLEDISHWKIAFLGEVSREGWEAYLGVSVSHHQHNPYGTLDIFSNYWTIFCRLPLGVEPAWMPANKPTQKPSSTC